MRAFLPKLLFLLCLSFISGSGIFAQAPKKPNSAEILLQLKKLNVLGTALYVAAHPDDENTALIAWLANEKMVNTGYLSLTRGDGGQNLIGPEIRERLGLIRTQELLQARRLDGGQQFFSRAVDFGFSKDYQETLKIWDKEKVLADMVWVIRKFRPDVMITRFSPEPGGTHGHHTTSAILASEAFEAAGDPKRFPEQLNLVQTWKPKRLLWNTSSFFYGPDRKFDPTGKVAIEISAFNPLMGKSYTEIAASSRSMHKSQGFGSGNNYGKVIEYLQPTKGEPAASDLFEGINLSWNRIPGGEMVGVVIQKTIEQYNPANPAASVEQLLQVKARISKIADNQYKNLKLAEVDELIKSCLGLYLEATAPQATATPGETINLTAIVVNRSSIPVKLNQVKISGNNPAQAVNQDVTKELLSTRIPMALPANMPYSQPYWLDQEGSLGMFTVNNQNLIGQAENKPALSATYSISVNGTALEYTVPVVYKRVDQVDGEIIKPFVISPPVYVALAEKVYIFADDLPKTVQVLVKAGKENMSGSVALQASAGWRIEPATSAFSLKQKDEEQLISFKIYPTKNQSEGILKAVANVGGQVYNKSLITIDYNHIPTQLLFPEASAKIARLDLKKKGSYIGYLAGAGDDVPASLSQIGYQVSLLQNTDLTVPTLQKYDAVVLGVRAYNTNDQLKFAQAALLEYVKNGGTLVVQYNVNRPLVLNEVGPYPLTISNNRVTVEEAPIRFLKPDHPVLNYPNKITSKDFEGWVQERGLYFPNQWDAQYEAVLSANDPGEAPQDGGLLVAKYGKGYYIYSGYAWFRQLPAGVPGAYRLFTNLISIGKK